MSDNAIADALLPVRGALADAGMSESVLDAAVARVTNWLRFADAAVAVPCRKEVMGHAVGGIMDLIYQMGVCGMTLGAGNNESIADVREKLVDRAIGAGFRRLLFLDPSCVLDTRSFMRLYDSLEQNDVAMVAALAGNPRHGVPFNAAIGGEDSARLVTMEDLPTSGRAFHVYRTGLTAAVIDLDKVKDISGPRFKAEGDGEGSEAFCRWLHRHDLEFMVDPGVTGMNLMQVPVMFGAGA